MPHYICPNCKAKYYSASNKVDKHCDKCGAEIEEEKDE
jgi:uncharacterized protein (DUF983 family)